MSKHKLLQRFMSSILLICFGSLTYAQSLTLGEKPFQDKEKVVYKVYYNWKFVWVPAGEVTFFVNEKGDHYEFNVHGKSYPSYDSFFEVRDYYVSRTEKENLIPHNFRRDILEGNYKRYDSISFNQVDYSLIEKFGKTKATAEDFNFQLEDKVLDMVSSIYYLRSLPIEQYSVQSQIPINIFFDKEHFTVKLNKLAEKKKKKIKNVGTLLTTHMQAELISGYVFQEGDVMDIWISDDANRIPVLIESPISFGSVKAVLKSVDNLKYPSELKKLCN